MSESGASGTSDVVVASLGAYGSVGSGVRLAHQDSSAEIGLLMGQAMSREHREGAQNVLMADGATRAVGAGVRRVEEEPDPVRTCFERDLDRVKHSTPFRRLAGKCQVFIAPDDVHLRTRITHAIEVAQVALAVARPLGLNLALVEAIALGHDCGHGPAGHASEDAFSVFLEEGYDHAIYGADVTLKHLNLCAETLDGIRHHSWRLPAPKTPEGEVVSWADRIAYVAHDFDDAVRAGIVTARQLPDAVTDVVGVEQRTQIGGFVMAMLAATEATGKIGMIEPAAAALDAFRRFNYDHIYLRPAAVSQADRVIELLRGLVEFYADSPGQIPSVKAGETMFPETTTDAYRVAVHYVSGMTDRFAIDAATRLLGWGRSELPRI